MLDLFEYLRTSQFEGSKNEYDSNILRFNTNNSSNNNKFGKIDPKINLSLNLHENLHTSQFEYNGYKYDRNYKF